jgi:hypothetical protein
MEKNKLVTINQTNIQTRGGNSMKMKKFVATVSALAIMGTAFVGGKAAFAADSTTAILGGSLSMTEPTLDNFASVTLNGQIQTTTASMGAFTVTDSTGTGNGWNVVVKASQFTTGGETPLTLPNNSLDIALPTVTAQEGATDASTITKLNGKIDNATGVKVLSAAADGGMGKYDIGANTLTLNLLPKDVKAGTYTSTVSVTVTTGP